MGRRVDALEQRIAELERITSMGPVTLTQEGYARLKEQSEVAETQAAANLQCIREAAVREQNLEATLTQTIKLLQGAERRAHMETERARELEVRIKELEKEKADIRRLLNYESYEEAILGKVEVYVKNACGETLDAWQAQEIEAAREILAVMP